MSELSFDHDDADVVFFDLETQSDCDLKTAGGRVYANHPTTRILSLVCRIDGTYHCWAPADLWPGRPPKIDPSFVWPDTRGAAEPVVIHTTATLPEPIAEATATHVFVAHNCLMFDRLVWEALITPVPSRWFDTDPAARSAGLPGGLDAIGERLFGGGKDSGRVIAKRYFSRSNAPVIKPGDYAAILRYNVDDVWLLSRLYAHVTQFPLDCDRVALNDRVNQRGIGFDAALARSLIDLSNEAKARAGEEIGRLTNGRLDATNLRTQEVQRWLADAGVVLPNMRRETVERFCSNPEGFADECDEAQVPCVVPGDVVPVLRLRNAALRNTAAKMSNALQRSINGRVYDLLVPFGAHTGRFTSRGLQIHNLPRPRKGVDVGALVDAHESGGLSYDLLAATATSARCTVDDVLSSLVRPVFRAGEGKTLVVCDFAAVECRGLAWAADEEKLLDAYRNGVDIYKQMASRIFGVPIAEVDSSKRQVGKNTILGCGYGMSSRRFGLFMLNQGVDLDAAGTTPEACVSAYREAYPAICGKKTGIWTRIGRAMMDVMNGKASADVAKRTFFRHGKNLICELPSGRWLVYRNARVEDRVPGYCALLGLPEFTVPTLLYDGHHGEGFLHGPKATENIVQADCNDVLVASMLNVRYPIVLHVHDEIVVEVDESDADAASAELHAVMSRTPEWATGFPLACEGHTNRRYGK